MKHKIISHKLKHFLFTQMKKKDIYNTLIQPYSKHKLKKSLELCFKLLIIGDQNKHNELINKFKI